MSYLIAEIFLGLLVTAGLSAVAAWLAAELLARRRLAKHEEQWQQRQRRSDARAGDFKNQLAEARQTEETLRAELHSLRERAASNPPEGSDSDRDTVEALHQEITRRDKKIEILQLQVGQVSGEWESINALKNDLAERQRRLELRGKQQGSLLAGRLKDSEAARAKLREQLQELKKRYLRREEELTALRRESAARITQPVAVVDAPTAPAEEPEVDRPTVVRPAVDRQAKPAAPPTEPVEQIDVPVAAPAEDISVKDIVSAADTVEDDDLQKIRGIGPVLRRKLNERGIRSFRQIAGWSDEDIDRTASQIGSFPGRIRRDRWVERATELLREKEASGQSSS